MISGINVGWVLEHFLHFSLPGHTARRHRSIWESKCNLDQCDQTSWRKYCTKCSPTSFWSKLIQKVGSTTERRTTERRMTERQTTERRMTERRTTECRTTECWKLKKRPNIEWLEINRLNIECGRMSNVECQILQYWTHVKNRTYYT
jgi:hypothetical protein